MRDGVVYRRTCYRRIYERPLSNTPDIYVAAAGFPGERRGPPSRPRRPRRVMNELHFSVRFRGWAASAMYCGDAAAVYGTRGSLGARGGVLSVFCSCRATGVAYGIIVFVSQRGACRWGSGEGVFVVQLILWWNFKDSWRSLLNSLLAVKGCNWRYNMWNTHNSKTIGRE